MKGPENDEGHAERNKRQKSALLDLYKVANDNKQGDKLIAELKERGILGKDISTLDENTEINADSLNDWIFTNTANVNGKGAREDQLNGWWHFMFPIIRNVDTSGKLITDTTGWHKKGKVQTNKNNPLQNIQYWEKDESATQNPDEKKKEDATGQKPPEGPKYNPIYTSPQDPKSSNKWGRIGAYTS
ncbi:MAG: hypothetical protein LUD48_00240 [Prevotella sp.]|nr:hypothetical protein [Prevotella sp.]